MLIGLIIYLSWTKGLIDYTNCPLQIVAESQKRGENALTEKREKVMLELDKLQR